MESKAVFGGGQGKAGEGDNKLNIDSIIARLLEGELAKDSQSFSLLISSLSWSSSMCHPAYRRGLMKLSFSSVKFP